VLVEHKHVTIQTRLIFSNNHSSYTVRYIKLCISDGGMENSVIFAAILRVIQDD
jgi:hypothetical protein